MIKFSQEKVLLLHQLLNRETGAAEHIRDLSLLNSALEGIAHSRWRKQIARDAHDV